MQTKKPNLSEIISSIRMSIASESEIRNWSSGEVTKPETINYKTYKPERNGLFCEMIFGTTKDFRCPNCLKKYKRVDEGKKCPNCGESEITSSLVRRRRMGHIELATPVSHIWFAKVDYSMMRLLLDLKQTTLDAVIYFKSHIIIEKGKLKSAVLKELITLQNGPQLYRKMMREILTFKGLKEIDIKIIKEKISDLEEYTMSDIGQDYGIDFYEYNEFIEHYSGTVIDTGARAIKRLLENIDIKLEKKKIQNKLNNTSDKSRLFRRLKVVEAFIKSKQSPSNMIFTVIPIIPADLRPLIQLDGGRHSTADVNELYRRIIIRNNRLKQWLAIETPELIVQNEKRMIQESIDALFDNQRKKTSVLSKDNRVLKSLAENLKGKQGRFRQNLLGKRVDYSGRSVIVGGPDLKINQVGIPKEMIIKLFEPFIVNKLVENEIAPNIKVAKKIIEVKDDRIWEFAEEIIKERPVLLNRAPTLHRLSIQAFQPVITNYRAIRLHPLVTTPFNADFDGDQMAVYVPISERAKKEAFELMSSYKNILGPKDGKLIIAPSQDIVLGIYYLTKTDKTQRGTGNIYSNLSEVKKALEMKVVHIHSPIFFSTKTIELKLSGKKSKNYPYLLTTSGKVLFNSILPDDVPYINNGNNNNSDFEKPDKFLFKYGTNLRDELKNLKTQIDFDDESKMIPFKHKDISHIIEIIYPNYKESISEILNNIKELGFEYSTKSGISISIGDIIDIKDKHKIIQEGNKQVEKFKGFYDEGMTTDDERYIQVIDVWTKVKDELQFKLSNNLSRDFNNSLFMMMDSGARGNISNFVQLTGMRGLMSKAVHVYATLKRQNILVRTTEEIPIKSSFKTGLSSFEFYLSTNGARKGLSDTATKTSESGYLTRRLIDAVQDIVVRENDCKTNSGKIVREIRDSKLASIIEPLYDRIIGRYSNETIKFNSTIIVNKNELITSEIAKKIIESKKETVEIRSALKCQTRRGVCQKCYGVDLTNGELVSIGEAIGIISAQSIGEPGTQLTMRTFHTGGVAGVSDITQGFSRLLELVDANHNPKSAAKISKINGVIKDVRKIIKDDKNNKEVIEIIIKNKNEEISQLCAVFDSIRVKKGETVKAGTKLTDGSIKLQELLEVAGIEALQNYMIKEIQRLYRIQGIEIADKYMEVIIKQMLSKVLVLNEGNTSFHAGEIISIDRLKEENSIAFEKSKKPAIVKPMILGIKPLPLHSESFLAAASYQRTAEALVSAAINMKVDKLMGIKENLIIGKKIPVGTGYKSPQGKYDIFSKIEEDEKKFSEEPDFNKLMDDIEITINTTEDKK